MYLKFTILCLLNRFVRTTKLHEEYLKRNRMQNLSRKLIKKSMQNFQNKSLLTSDSRNNTVVQKMHTVETTDVFSNNKMEAAVTNGLRGQSETPDISKMADVENLLPPYPTEEEEAENAICNVNTKASVIKNHNKFDFNENSKIQKKNLQEKLKKLKGIEIEKIPNDDITKSTKIMDKIIQNPKIIQRETTIEKMSFIKSKTKVELSINGNTDTVSWIKVSKPPNTITLNDIKKLLKKTPKMYGLSSEIMYHYRVKVLDDGQVGFENIDEDNSILPLFGDKIVLQCWSQ